MSLGQWGGSVVGNDAVIVAHRVKEKGTAVRCILVHPTNADLQTAKRLIGWKVSGVGICRGTLTRSLCMEDVNGSRKWVVSRVVRPSGDLRIGGTTILYLDYYAELRNFLNRANRQILASHSSVFVNLSDISTLTDVPRLTFTPNVLQASITAASSRDEAFRLCARLLDLTGTKYVFVTMGHRGAALATPAGMWFVEPTSASKATVLGSGAVFSAEAIAGLLQGIEGEELLEQVVRNTAVSLQTNEDNCLRGNKRIR
jgi:hypothetical protein